MRLHLLEKMNESMLDQKRMKHYSALDSFCQDERKETMLNQKLMKQCLTEKNEM